VEKSMRDAFGEAILKLAEKNDRVFGLTADLGSSVRLNALGEKFRERYLNVGVAEANMIGVAAGLALEGFIPFAASFAVFLPGRCFDQIRVSVCQNKANVKLVGSHAGLSNPGDGATAQSVCDLALMRSLPEMKIICPADANQTEKAVAAAAEIEGPVYLRLSRAETPVFTSEKAHFSFGEAEVLREGKKITLISCGSLVYNCLEVGDELDAEVINLHTIKPLDRETILNSARKTGRVLTIEEHSVLGGLGSAVAELLAQENPVPMKIMGIADSFGESARSYQELLQKFNLTSDDIVRQAKSI
jgi:transketolase